MNGVESAVKDYVASLDLSAGDVELGGGRPGFDTQLERARARTQTGYWICVVMLIVLFIVVLFVSWRSFDQLVALGASEVAAASGIFGLSAGTCVRLMMRWSRESGRADILLVFLRDLRDRKPAEFDNIITLLAHEWYGLAPVPGKKEEPAPTSK